MFRFQFFCCCWRLFRVSQPFFSFPVSKTQRFFFFRIFGYSNQFFNVFFFFRKCYYSFRFHVIYLFIFFRRFLSSIHGFPVSVHQMWCLLCFTQIYELNSISFVYNFLFCFCFSPCFKSIFITQIEWKCYFSSLAIRCKKQSMAAVEILTSVGLEAWFFWL